MTDTKALATELRDIAANANNYFVAQTLLRRADEIDPPKPKVSVRHAIPRCVVVEFERKEDASAISHFLYTAQNVIDGLYPNDVRKREVIREFVDAWHNRTGK